MTESLAGGGGRTSSEIPLVVRRLPYERSLVCVCVGPCFFFFLFLRLVVWCWACVGVFLSARPCALRSRLWLFERTSGLCVCECSLGHHPHSFTQVNGVYVVRFARRCGYFVRMPGTV